MNCDYCKDKLSAFIDNELSSEERLLMEAHLTRCPSCRAELESLRQIGILFERLPEETPSPAFMQTTVNKAAVILRRSLREKLFLNPVFSFIRNAAAIVFAPDRYDTHRVVSLSSNGYLRAFDDSPPGSFSDVYLTVIQGGGN